MARCRPHIREKSGLPQSPDPSYGDVRDPLQSRSCVHRRLSCRWLGLVRKVHREQLEKLRRELTGTDVANSIHPARRFDVQRLADRRPSRRRTVARDSRRSALDSKEIRLREPVMHPDALIIQDPGLLHQVNLFEGLSQTGFVIINSSRNLENLGLGELKQSHPGCKGCTVPAVDLARKNVGRPASRSAFLTPRPVRRRVDWPRIRLSPSIPRFHPATPGRCPSRAGARRKPPAPTASPCCNR